MKRALVLLLAFACGPVMAGEVGPTPLETTVRIHVALKPKSPGEMPWGAVGSGTVIWCDGKDAVALTCAHLFYDVDSSLPVRVHIFDGKPSGQQQQAALTDEFNATRFDFDQGTDLGFVAFRPGKQLPVAKLVPEKHLPKVGETMTVSGCRLGANPNSYQCNVISTGVSVGEPPAGMARTMPQYRAIRVTLQATHGRSGGGLFDSQNRLCGVLNIAWDFPPLGVQSEGDCSLFAQPNLIHAFLDRFKVIAK